MRQKLVDHTGQIFPKGTAVDVVARHGELIVFEVKASCGLDEVTTFAHKVRLMKAQHADKDVRGVFISFGAGEQTRQYGEEQGIELLN